MGCRTSRRKDELVRIVRIGVDGAKADPSAAAPGRGAYVCGVGCFDRAMTKGRLARALRVVLDAATAARLRDDVVKGER